MWESTATHTHVKAVKLHEASLNWTPLQFTTKYAMKLPKESCKKLYYHWGVINQSNTRNASIFFTFIYYENYSLANSVIGRNVWSLQREWLLTEVKGIKFF